ncbi:MAG: OmpA family protein [Kofleriaceae bacterium]
MRLVMVTALWLCASTARSEPRLETGGFVGLGYYSDDIELGNSWASDQVPGSAPLVGGRVGWLAAPELVTVSDRLRVQLAIEAELAIAPAFTGGATFGTGRMSYFAPVFAWRAFGVVRLAGWKSVRPHLSIGGGGETVASSSPFMSKETDPVFSWGPGVSIPVSSDWQLRIDFRHGVMPSRGEGATSVAELQLGLATSFGLATAPPPAPPKTEKPAADLDKDRDGDRDGFPDWLDQCPAEAETVNGISDDDGCAEPDADGDGVLGEGDACPDQAEDLDEHQDLDGCPELDNDLDGIADTQDGCPGNPETKNGFDDDDGCPDQLPPDITKDLAAASAQLKFEPKRARVTEKAQAQLQPVIELLRTHRAVHIMIVGHPDRAANQDLAKRRSEAVKWFMVDQGLAADRIDTSVGAVAKSPPIELQMIAPAN